MSIPVLSLQLSRFTCTNDLPSLWCSKSWTGSSKSLWYVTALGVFSLNRSVCRPVH
jgi:hypothetical protein